MVATKPVKKASAPKAKAAKKATPKKVTPKKASPAAKKSPKTTPKPKKATPAKKSPAPKSAKKSPAAAKAKSPAPAAKAAAGGAAKLVILHTKECGCFGVRATRLINAMKAVNPNLSFTINPERAEKGSFTLKTEGGKALWSMTGLKRPFPTFKAVDFEELGAKLAKEL